MRICYLGDAPSPHLIKFVNYFAQSGDEIHVVTLREAQLTDAILHRMPYRTRFEDVNYLLSLFWLKRTIKSIDPDIVHAHYLTSFGFLAALLGFHPLVTTAWGTDLLLTPRKSFVYRWLLRFTLRRADLIFVVADFMKKELLKYADVERKTLVCPMGVDVHAFSGKGRQFKGTPRCRLLSMRALIKNSNIDVIIKSASILKDRGIDFSLAIANRGAEEENLKRMSTELGLGKLISFEGFVRHKHVHRYFINSDIYISVTSSDGASVTLMEAMASGVLPVVSDISANREWIEDGVNGFLVPPNDPNALADKIIAGFRNGDLRRRAAEVNRGIIKKKGELIRTMSFVGRQYELLTRQRESKTADSETFLAQGTG